MLIVTMLNAGVTYYLKGTVWTSARERAQEFESGAAALVAVDKAKKFLPKKSMAKLIQIKEG